MTRLHRYTTLSAIALVLGTLVGSCQASIYLDASFSEKVFDSVVYFEFSETKWPYVEMGDIVEGPITALNPAQFDTYYEQYNAYHQQTSQSVEDIYVQNNSSTSSQSVPSSTDNEMEGSYSASDIAPHHTTKYRDFEVTTPPKFMILEFGASQASSSIENIRHVAVWLGVDFVVLVPNSDVGFWQQINFWWSHKFPGTTLEQLYGNKNHEQGEPKCFFLAVGIEEGEVILETLKRFETSDVTNDKFYFGMDGLSPLKGRFFAERFIFYVLLLLVFWRITKNLDSGEQAPIQEEDYIQFTGKDLAIGEVQVSTKSHECCICLEHMPPGEKVRVLPCRHVFHHTCISGWFEQKKYNCPMCKLDVRSYMEECRLVAETLTELVQDEYLTFNEEEDQDQQESSPSFPTFAWHRRFFERVWPAARKIEDLNEDTLISMEASAENAVIERELELTEESSRAIT